MSAENNQSNLLKHELTTLPIIAEGTTVALWTVNFECNEIKKGANVEQIESEKFFYAGQWWKMCLAMNSEFATKGVLKMVDPNNPVQVNYVILVLDSTGSMIHYWSQFCGKVEKQKKGTLVAVETPLNETPKHVPPTPFTLSKKSIEDGCFTLCCLLSLSRSYVTEQLKKLKDESHKDVAVITQRKTIGAHRFMLASHSSAFNDWLKNGDSSIRLLDFKSEVVEAMLTFIYSKRIPNFENVAVDLIRMAQKYDIHNLTEQCEKSLCETISVENAVRLQALADIYNLDKLNTKTKKFIDRNIKDIQATWEWKEVIREYWLKFEERKQISGKRSKPSSM